MLYSNCNLKILEGVYHMENKTKETNKKQVTRECGVYTCIHCVISTCTLDECEMFERKFSQEG